MARSTCPKCDNHSFEVVIDSPSKSNFKMAYIQCTSCGAVVGVTEYYNIGNKLQELEEKIEKLRSNNSSNISATLETIDANIRALYNLVKSKQS